MHSSILRVPKIPSNLRGNGSKSAHLHFPKVLAFSSPDLLNRLDHKCYRVVRSEFDELQDKKKCFADTFIGQLMSNMVINIVMRAYTSLRPWTKAYINRTGALLNELYSLDQYHTPGIVTMMK